MFDQKPPETWENQFSKPSTNQNFTEPKVVETKQIAPVVQPKDLTPKPNITATDIGLLMGKSFDEQLRIAGIFAASEMVPKAFRNRPDNVLAAWQTAIELGLKPYSALRQIAVINGTPSLWGELPLSLCMKSGNVVSFDEYFTDENYDRISIANKNMKSKVFAAVCTIERKNPSRKVEIVFSFDDARTAGLINKDIWKNYPKRMLQMRARGWALKDCFPDVLSGVGQAEYDFDLVPTESGVFEIEKTPQSKRGFAGKLTGKTKDLVENADGKDGIETMTDLFEKQDVVL